MSQVDPSFVMYTSGSMASMGGQGRRYPACKYCKEAKTKCDSVPGSRRPCTTCARLGRECVPYRIHQSDPVGESGHKTPEEPRKTESNQSPIEVDNARTTQPTDPVGEDGHKTPEEPRKTERNQSPIEVDNARTTQPTESNVSHAYESVMGHARVYFGVSGLPYTEAMAEPSLLQEGDILKVLKKLGPSSWSVLKGSIQTSAPTSNVITLPEAFAEKHLSLERLSVRCIQVNEDFFKGFSGPKGRDQSRFMSHHNVFVPSSLTDSSSMVICGMEKAVEAAAEEVEGLLRFQAMFNSTTFYSIDDDIEKDEGNNGADSDHSS